MKNFSNIFLFSGLLLGASAFFVGCDRNYNPMDNNLSSHRLSEYKDFFEMIATGSDCNDLKWMVAHCASDPGGDWAGNVKGGFCGDTGKSCFYAVAVRNRQLACWQDDKAPSCS